MAARGVPPVQQHHPDLHSKYGEAKKLFEIGQISAARSILEQLVGREPTPDSLYLLGVCRFRRQDYQGAEDTFRRLLASVPTHHLVVYYLGLTFERQGLGRESLQMFEQAVQLKPDFREAREKIAARKQAVVKSTKTTPAPTEASPTPVSMSSGLRAGFSKGRGATRPSLASGLTLTEAGARSPWKCEEPAWRDLWPKAIA